MISLLSGFLVWVRGTVENTETVQEAELGQVEAAIRLQNFARQTITRGRLALQEDERDLCKMRLSMSMRAGGDVAISVLQRSGVLERRIVNSDTGGGAAGRVDPNSPSCISANLESSMVLVPKSDEFPEEVCPEPGFYQRLLTGVLSISQQALALFVSGNDEKNQEKFLDVLVQLRALELPKDGELETIDGLLSCELDLPRAAYRGVVDEMTRLAYLHGSQVEGLDLLCEKIWCGIDLSRLFVEDISDLLEIMELRHGLEDFDSFIALNQKFDLQLKSSTMGKSKVDLTIQKFYGARRSMVWLHHNIPNVRETQLFSCVESQEVSRIPFVRHSNAVRAEYQLDPSIKSGEILDPSFEVMVRKKRGDGEFVFYASLLNHKEKIFENEFLGNKALIAAQDRLDNFHVLLQSVCAPLFKTSSGTSERLIGQLLEAFRDGSGASEEYFMLPHLITEDESLKAEYLSNISQICDQILMLLFDGKEAFSNDEWKTFCMIFFAMQRDHMKLFLQKHTGLSCGHYVNPCKDDLDRGGVNALVERMLHEAMMGTFHSNKRQWLDDEKFSLLGATWAVKKIGVIDSRLQLAAGVYNLFETKSDSLKGFVYDVSGTAYRITEVKSYVRAFINS